MRIGIDIDDTICDTFDFVLPYCCKYYGVDYEKAISQKLSLQYFIDNYGYFDFAKKYYGKIIPYVPLKKDVVKYINKMKKRGHQIIFLTARSNRGYDNPYQLTYDYLIKHNIPFDTLITDAKEKGTVCRDEEIDIYIDDNIKECMAINKEGVKVVLFDTRFNHDNKDFKRIKNFKQFYKFIKKEEKNGRRKSNNKS